MFVLMEILVMFLIKGRIDINKINQEGWNTNIYSFLKKINLIDYRAHKKFKNKLRGSDQTINLYIIQWIKTFINKWKFY